MIEKGRPLDCALIDNPLFLPTPASWRWWCSPCVCT